MKEKLRAAKEMISRITIEIILKNSNLGTPLMASHNKSRNCHFWPSPDVEVGIKF